MPFRAGVRALKPREQRFSGALHLLAARPELELQFMAMVPAKLLCASLARVRITDAHLIQLRFPILASLAHNVRHRRSHLPSSEPSKNRKKEAHPRRCLALCGAN